MNYYLKEKFPNCHVTCLIRGSTIDDGKNIDKEDDENDEENSNYDDDDDDDVLKFDNDDQILAQQRLQSVKKIIQHKQTKILFKVFSIYMF